MPAPGRAQGEHATPATPRVARTAGPAAARTVRPSDRILTLQRQAGNAAVAALAARSRTLARCACGAVGPAPCSCGSHDGEPEHEAD